MDDILISITKTYEKYKNNNDTLQQINYYITTQLPVIVENYDKKMKKKHTIRKESGKYIEYFLSGSAKKQYFHIPQTDNFILYNEINYSIIPEDDIWYSI